MRSTTTTTSARSRRTVGALATALLLTTAAAHGVTLWTTTFSGADGSNRDLAVANGDPSFTDTLTGDDANLTFQDTSFAGTVFMHSGNLATGTHYSPRTNVDNPGAAAPQNGGWWQAEFRFTGGSQAISVQSVTLEAVWSNSAGNFQVGDTVVRDITLTLDYSVDGGGSWAPVDAAQTYNLTVNPGTTAQQYQNRVYTAGTPISVDHASQDLWLRVRAENSGATAGAYVDLRSIVVDGVVVPEPGSLAFVALAGGLIRRRRRSEPAAATA